MARRPIPVHFQEGPGTACLRLIRSTATKICYTQDITQVTCRKCLAAKEIRVPGPDGIIDLVLNPETGVWE